MTGLGKARSRFTVDWHDLQESLRKETGKSPRWTRSLTWPVLALAAGVALGAHYRWRRGRKD